MTASALARRIINSIRSFEWRREYARKSKPAPLPIEAIATTTTPEAPPLPSDAPADDVVSRSHHQTGDD